MQTLTGVRRRAGASGNRNQKLQLQGLGDELEAFSEVLRRRPEVRIVNKYAVFMAYIRIGLKGIGALALLWATVVLLGGFVSSVSKVDFWYLTIIAFLQAAGIFDAVGDARFGFYEDWLNSLMRNVDSWGEKDHLVRTQLPMRQWLNRQLDILALKVIDIILIMIFVPVVYFALVGPMLCIVLSASRLADEGYGIANGETINANLKRGLKLYHYVSIAYGAICLLCMYLEMVADEKLIVLVSRRHGINLEVLDGYLRETKQMCLHNPSSTMNWNLITYGVGLLDSQLPEDYASGGRVLTMLIDQDTPVPITWLLIRSPRQRIQKLIGTLSWSSPAEREMRWLAARIVEHLAGHLNLAQFPGALECISSLFDTSCHKNGDQEALHWPFLTEHSKQRKRALLHKTIGHALIFRKGGTLEQDSKQREIGEGIDEDLVLPGLRILENLAHDKHNCTLIYNTKDLLSKIVTPVSSSEFVQDIKTDAAWTKVVDGSLKVVSRLMGSSGSTDQKMRRLIANNSNAVQNLEAVLDMDMKSKNGIIELKMRAIEILTEIALHHPASISAEKLVERALHIFVSIDWMEDYLKDEKSRMKEAKKTANQLKEKAGEALAMLSGDSEAINRFTACTDANIRHLTELLDSNIKIIKCKISATDTVEIEIDIRSRISAAVILKHLRNHNMEPTLRKVLAELLPVQAAAVGSTLRCWQRLLPIRRRNDLENPMVGGQDEPSASQSHHIQQCGEGRLQAELISLVAAIRPNNNLDFAAILISQTPPVSLEDFVVRLKEMVEDNMHATPTCLAIQKLTCEMVTGFLNHDQNVKVIDKHNIVGALQKASQTMAKLECSMLFAGVDRDSHGVPLKPRLIALANTAADLLTQRKQALGIHTALATVPVGPVPLP